MVAFLLIGFHKITAQCSRWQLRTNYTIDATMDVRQHQLNGTTRISLLNNSPDTLAHLFFHTYFNAFQPGSEMDIRSRTISDPDRRVFDRISKLYSKEMGYMRLNSITVNGYLVLTSEEFGSIYKVTLSKPVLPGQLAEITLNFEAQVPLQIRRNGRMNEEGVHYSMAQWYPKLCHYDQYGWHTNAYIGREFHGMFGEFDVRITIDSAYVLAGTGYLQNADEIGKGYTRTKIQKSKNKGGQTTWHFKANDVHDFVWAADPDYVHITDTTPDGIILRAFYKPSEKTNEFWPLLPKIMKAAFSYIQPTFGAYPYKTYSFIQGGDGGMEYPMATLITGHRNLASLVGVSIHELMHSWYHGVLGFNESRYHWMDEGFTTYASERVMQFLSLNGYIPGQSGEKELFARSYTGYLNLLASGVEEPMSTHADHFEYNTAYGLASYSKGSLFLHQLSGIIGQNLLDSTLRTFYVTCAFKHPEDVDFIRIAERLSGMQLRWYLDYWVYSTKFIDYKVLEPGRSEDGLHVLRMERLGAMPMPLELKISFKNGQYYHIYIPINLLYGYKTEFREEDKTFRLSIWDWVNPVYEAVLPWQATDIQSVEIDPFNTMMDADRQNNIWPVKH
jgi:hypothetical protein